MPIRLLGPHWAFVYTYHYLGYGIEQYYFSSHSLFLENEKRHQMRLPTNDSPRIHRIAYDLVQILAILDELSEDCGKEIRATSELKSITESEMCIRYSESRLVAPDCLVKFLMSMDRWEDCQKLAHFLISSTLDNLDLDRFASIKENNIIIDMGTAEDLPSQSLDLHLDLEEDPDFKLIPMTPDPPSPSPLPPGEDITTPAAETKLKNGNGNGNKRSVQKKKTATISQSSIKSMTKKEKKSDKEEEKEEPQDECNERQEGMTPSSHDTDTETIKGVTRFYPPTTIPSKKQVDVSMEDVDKCFVRYDGDIRSGIIHPKDGFGIPYMYSMVTYWLANKWIGQNEFKILIEEHSKLMLKLYVTESPQYHRIDPLSSDVSHSSNSESSHNHEDVHSDYRHIPNEPDKYAWERRLTPRTIFPNFRTGSPPQLKRKFTDHRNDDRHDSRPKKPRF